MGYCHSGLSFYKERLEKVTPEQRRDYQRARYNKNPTAKKHAALKRYHEQKEKGQEEFDAADYASEFAFSTGYLGMAAREIVTRSVPGASFFRHDVLPRISLARCGVCRRYFDPAVTMTFPECSAECAHLYQWGK